MRKQVISDIHAAHMAGNGLCKSFYFFILCMDRFQPDQTDNRLKIILDPVMYLMDQRHAVSDLILHLMYHCLIPEDNRCALAGAIFPDTADDRIHDEIRCAYLSPYYTTMFCKIRPIAIRNVQFAASAADQRQFKSLILIQNFCLGIDKCTYSICIIKKNGILKIIAGFSKLPVKRILFSFPIIDNTDRLCICTGIGIFVCQRPYYLFFAVKYTLPFFLHQ